MRMSAALVGKSAEYVLGYTEGYQNKSRDKNTTWACAGWCAWAFVYVAFILPTMLEDDESW